jgi:arsenate reductase
MSRCIIWHNPRCSKSRAGLAYLQERGIEPEIVRYLETPPAVDTLRDVLARLGLHPRELSLKTVTDEDRLIEAMAAHPKLIERPVVICGDRAVIGRPAEAIEALLPQTSEGTPS